MQSSGHKDEHVLQCQYMVEKVKPLTGHILFLEKKPEFK